MPVAVVKLPSICYPLAWPSKSVNTGHCHPGIATVICRTNAGHPFDTCHRCFARQRRNDNKKVILGFWQHSDMNVVWNIDTQLSGQSTLRVIDQQSSELEVSDRSPKQALMDSLTNRLIPFVLLHHRLHEQRSRVANTVPRVHVASSRPVSCIAHATPRRQRCWDGPSITADKNTLVCHLPFD